jgi:hypothetical protein
MVVHNSIPTLRFSQPDFLHSEHPTFSFRPQASLRENIHNHSLLSCSANWYLFAGFLPISENFSKTPRILQGLYGTVVLEMNGGRDNEETGKPYRTPGAD